MEFSIIFFTCFFLGVVPSTNAACHGHHICTGESNTAVENLDLLFSVRLCYTILAFNCDDHILTQDEQVCGNDGVTYDNHCLFTQARCRAAPNIHGNAHVTLGVRNHGPCAKDATTIAPVMLTNEGTMSSMQSTTGSVLTASTQQPMSSMQSTTRSVIIASTQQPISLMQSSTGSAFISTTKQPDVVQSSATMAVVSDSMTTSVQMPLVSTDSNLVAASSSPMPMDTTTVQQFNGTTIDTGNVFCKNADSLTCTGLSIICGSDGTYYFNECEFRKANCKDPSLTKTTDATVCSNAP